MKQTVKNNALSSITFLGYDRLYFHISSQVQVPITAYYIFSKKKKKTCIYSAFLTSQVRF